MLKIKFTLIAVQKTRINHQIKVPELRVIDGTGKMLGIMKTSEALKLAEEQEVDLVEISPNANPPVAKLLNYDKYRYHQRKMAQEARKKVKKVMVKGVRLSVRIGEHDLNFKSKQVHDFLSHGHKVKIEVRMRGREQAHPELAYNLIKKFISEVTIPHVIEVPPKRMGRTVAGMISPQVK
jgi:translation initiation factor IF-3